MYFFKFLKNPTILHNQHNHTPRHDQPLCMFTGDPVFSKEAAMKHLCTIEMVRLLVTFVVAIQVKLINPTFGHIRQKPT